MAIITKQTVSVEYDVVHARASRHYISVFSKYLSQAYDLVSGDEIKGEIISVREGKQEYSELKGKRITLILDNLIIVDRLFISKTDWNSLFREWGLISPGYEIELRLTEAIRHLTKESIELYTKRDVTVL